MIEVIQGLPPHVTAFCATGKVTKDDYYKVINPLVKKVAATFGKINYMLVLNTELKNYNSVHLFGLEYFNKKIAYICTLIKKLQTAQWQLQTKKWGRPELTGWR